MLQLVRLLVRSFGADASRLRFSGTSNRQPSAVLRCERGVNSAATLGGAIHSMVRQKQDQSSHPSTLKGSLASRALNHVSVCGGTLQVPAGLPHCSVPQASGEDRPWGDGRTEG
mmetsp:Transcript_13561/g.21187  ORF Transcript_13561/g.21187 Transcript_13561/m.21187 type:complete len:114 (+) Transcript_13561:55-396(+)